jgi:hypothetical protein
MERCSRPAVEAASVPQNVVAVGKQKLDLQPSLKLARWIV